VKNMIRVELLIAKLPLVSRVRLALLRVTGCNLVLDGHEGESVSAHITVPDSFIQRCCLALIGLQSAGLVFHPFHVTLLFIDDKSQLDTIKTNVLMLTAPTPYSTEGDQPTDSSTALLPRFSALTGDLE
jgi:hypothetical protein